MASLGWCRAILMKWCSAVQSLFVALLLLAASCANAGVTPEAYRNVGVTVPANAAVPGDAVVTDENGRQRRIADMIIRPAVLVFADYTCTTLCGPIVDFVTAALEQSGLPPDQFQLLFVGLDPKDTAADAGRMRRTHLTTASAINAATVFVSTDAANIQRLTAALGYRYAYDEEHDQFVHPAAAFVLRADGRVAKVVTGLGISASDLRLALVEAGEGRIGTFGDEVRLLCSGFDPQHGVYNVLISRVLAGSAIATVMALGGTIGLLALVSRRRRAT